MRPSLLRQPDFVKLWAGQTISIFGTLIGRFAFVLVAVMTLNASPFEVGLLRVADMASALSLVLIRRGEVAAPVEQRTGAWRETREGLSLLVGEPVLRAFAGAKVTREFFIQAWAAVLVLFLSRDLGLTPLEMGLLFAI